MITVATASLRRAGGLPEAAAAPAIRAPGRSGRGAAARAEPRKAPQHTPFGALVGDYGDYGDGRPLTRETRGLSDLPCRVEQLPLGSPRGSPRVASPSRELTMGLPSAVGLGGFGGLKSPAFFDALPPDLDFLLEGARGAAPPVPATLGGLLRPKIVVDTQQSQPRRDDPPGLMRSPRHGGAPPAPAPAAAPPRAARTPGGSAPPGFGETPRSPPRLFAAGGDGELTRYDGLVAFLTSLDLGRLAALFVASAAKTAMRTSRCSSPRFMDRQWSAMIATCAPRSA